MDQYLPGACSLIESLDSKIMVILRDGRTFIGIVRTFDQYLNIVLENAIERLTHENYYCDISVGLFIVRGDTIVLLGEVDTESKSNLVEVSHEELIEKISNEAKKIDWDLE